MHNDIFVLQSTGQGMEIKLKTGLVSTHAYSINNVVEVGCDNCIFPFCIYMIILVVIVSDIICFKVVNYFCSWALKRKR